MTVIELPDEIGAQLKAKAAAAGLTLEDWFRRLAGDSSDGPFLKAGHLASTQYPLAGLPNSLEGCREVFRDGSEKARAFEEWAEGHRYTPPLSDDAVSRARLVRDVC